MIKKINNTIRLTTHTEGGFAMLFTVLIVSIIMSIAIGISNVSFKQNLLSSVAKDSQVAFFAADAGVECGLYYDLTAGVFPKGFAVAETPTTIYCGANSFSRDTARSSVDYIVYKENTTDNAKACRSIVFNKLDPTISKVQSRGYSVCNNSPRQVERALEVRY